MNSTIAIFAAAPKGVQVPDARRIRLAPGAIVSGQRS